MSSADQPSWPVFICGFRPFFVLAASGAVLLMLSWLLILRGMLPGSLPGGSIVWHGHELIFGFVAAAICGFVLTAVPEFTQDQPVSCQRLIHLVLLWIAARLSWALAGLWPAWLGLWPVMLFNLGLWALLLASVAPSLWRGPERRHLSFFWALSTLTVLEAGFFIALLVQADALAWLRMAVGVALILIVMVNSRVSMVVVNGLMEQGRPGEPEVEEVGYLARPPRRNLAIFCIASCSLTEFFYGHDPVSGWTALAASAAMLNLLNDWHVGRPLFTRWALMMYAFYWLIALGYALLGAAWLGAALLPSAGRHLLMAGAMGGSIFTIMAVVGRIHAGRWLDRRAWLPISFIVLIVAALLRASAGVFALASWTPNLLLASGLLWASCFALYLVMAWPVLTGPREDGLSGCDEPPGREVSGADA